MKKLTAITLFLALVSCHTKQTKMDTKQITEPLKIDRNDGMETATFAGGCFWCTEAVFLELEGVKSVKPGYIGGETPNPTYRDVCGGGTGHAEAIQIVFDPKLISYGELLEVFFATHDPTTLNRQGNDVGTQYRSEIFYHDDAQKQSASDYIALLDRENTYGKKVVTAISPAPKFHVAEDYHQNYYSQNKQQGYCSYIITPKIDKVRKQFKDKLKH